MTSKLSPNSTTVYHVEESREVKLRPPGGSHVPGTNKAKSQSSSWNTFLLPGRLKGTEMQVRDANVSRGEWPERRPQAGLEHCGQEGKKPAVLGAGVP